MRVSWTKGGEGEVVEARDIHVTVTSTVPFPPGCPAEGMLHSDAAMPFVLKVAGSRKEGERFLVRGRLLSASVALREAFARSVVAAS